MNTARRLTPDQVRRTCPVTVFDFETTTELEPAPGLIGQDRAVRALEFGLGISSPGYNIYVSGPTGTGRTTYATSLVRDTAGTLIPSDDWCYVHRFDRPSEPVALRLPPGHGVSLARDVAEALTELRSELPRAFDSEAYEKGRNAVIRVAQDRANRLLAEVESLALQSGFALTRTPTGLASVPAIDGKPMTPEQFEALDESERARLNEAGTAVRDALQSALRTIRQEDRETKKKLMAYDQATTGAVAEPLVEDLVSRYEEIPQVVDYLRAWLDDVITNVDRFVSPDPPPSTSPASRPDRDDFFIRYAVNLFVDNSELTGAPVVIETNPTYYNLCGRMEYRGAYGSFVTDFTLIKAGALHRANGGYLILQAVDLLSSPLSWEALKRALKNRQVRVENMGDPRMELVSSPAPEPVPLDVKVILIGPMTVRELLHAYDDDFRKLFKIRADFDVSMDRSAEQVTQYSQFIASICDREQLRPFDRSAVAKVVEHGSRLVDDQNKLSTRFNEILDVVYEANNWAGQSESELVTAQHVRQALEEQHYRSGLIETHLLEMIERGQLLVDVAGAVVGQINGLAVYQLGDHQFGKPSRITARASVGRRGVVDIERESELGGRLHSKGVLILGGYLGQLYARDRALTLNASLCLEQNYGGVDGDSASAAELVALLSAISGCPINQGIAMTGSVNQNGESQPVGGVTSKIEGFYNACRLLGFTGSQGVIIPRRNAANLMLCEEIVDAIAAGEFHVWVIDHIDDAIELLTGVPAGTPNDPDTFHGRVAKQLSEWSARTPAVDCEAGDGCEGCDR